MKKRLTIIQMDVHVNDVEYNYTRVQELLSQSLSETQILLYYQKPGILDFIHLKS